MGRLRTVKINSRGLGWVINTRLRKHTARTALGRPKAVKHASHFKCHIFAETVKIGSWIESMSWARDMDRIRGLYGQQVLQLPKVWRFV